MSGCPGGAVPTPGQARAVLRWKLGHHLFHVQLIAMNSLLAEVPHALDTRAWPHAVTLLRRLTVLYDAASAAMRYAADFPTRQYTELIRPSMAPPMLSPGFSGESNRDHTHMVERVRTVRTRIRQEAAAGVIPSTVVQEAQALFKAQARNRRQHMLICERFVPGGTSQLQEFFDRQQEAETS